MVRPLSYPTIALPPELRQRISQLPQYPREAIEELIDAANWIVRPDGVVTERDRSSFIRAGERALAGAQPEVQADEFRALADAVRKRIAETVESGQVQVENAAVADWLGVAARSYAPDPRGADFNDYQQKMLEDTGLGRAPLLSEVARDPRAFIDAAVASGFQPEFPTDLSYKKATADGQSWIRVQIDMLSGWAREFAEPTTELPPPGVPAARVRFTAEVRDGGKRVLFHRAELSLPTPR